MNSRLSLLTFLAFGLFILGLATLNGTVLALIMPLLAYIGAALLDRPAPPSLRAERKLSAERAAVNTPINVLVRLTNTGATLWELRATDLLPGGVEVIDGDISVVGSLAPGATLELRYTIRADRGLHLLDQIKIEATDHSGLQIRRDQYSAPARLFILPEIVRMRRIGIRPRRTRVYAGQIRARQGGAGIDFFSVRAYQPGDPLRYINDRVSARHFNDDALFVNEFEQERVADVGIILDARRSSDSRIGNHTLFEYGVQAAATLADGLLSQGNRVGLLVYGASADWTLPGYGKLQRERIMLALARAQSGDHQAFERLDSIPTRIFPVRSQLILISPLLPNDLTALTRLRAREFQVIVISPDPVGFEQRAYEQTQPVLQAARLATLERNLLIRSVRRIGVPVIDWDIRTPFHALAEQALSGIRV
jgi:uncharacterized protein (DUF58 family)